MRNLLYGKIKVWQACIIPCHEELIQYKSKEYVVDIIHTSNDPRGSVDIYRTLKKIADVRMDFHYRCL